MLLDNTEDKNKTNQLNEVMEMAKMAFWEYDVVHDEFTFNDLFYMIFRTNSKNEDGYKMSSAEYAKKFVHPDDAYLVGMEVKKALEAKDPNFSSHLDHRIIRADGTTGYITIYIRIKKDDQGKTIKTYGINQDISERKELQEELSAKVEQLEKLNRIMIDRELMMVKLKEEIARLKGSK